MREAILAANADAAVNECPTGGGADTITFRIPGDGMQTIPVLQDLPFVESTVTIDGYSQRAPDRTVGRSAATAATPSVAATL